MYTDLLPQPREIVLREGVCNSADLKRAAITGLSPETAALLREDLPDIELLVEEGSQFTAILAAETDSSAIDESLIDRLPDPEQSFLIDIAPDRVQICARDAAGLWYGLQTFVQLRRRFPENWPAARLRDWPAIRWRGIHIDLKGYQPRFEKLLDMLRLLSHFRVNQILLEVEDKFAYQCAPDVGIPGAYTADQFRRLGRLARDLSIQIVPKLQSLGHVDYLLKHERYRHLREADHPFQYCPRSQEGMEPWQNMAQELIDCFPDHDYFHIGADETGNLGQCPICSQHSKASSYVYRVQQCIDAVRAAGRQPIMWEDILRNLHGNLDESELEETWSLGDGSILMYWAYGYGGRGNTFPLLPRYLARDMKVWGASGFSGCGPSWIQNVPPFAERALNIAAWTKTAVENRLEGVVATGWTRIASADPPAEPPETCWFSILYAAESTWSGQERDLDAFCRTASLALFGTDLSSGYGSYLLDMNADNLPAESTLKAPRQQERLDLFTAAAAVTRHDRRRRELEEVLQLYHGHLGDQMPDYRIDFVRGRIGSFSSSLQQCRAEFESSLSALYEPSTVADVLRSRFGRDAELLEQAEALLEKTRQI